MAKIKIPDTPNVTLVAFYEKERVRKSDAFGRLIGEVQELVRTECRAADSFCAYDRKQVHATVLGCEGAKVDGGVLSKWFWEKRKEQRYINFEQLLRYFRWNSNLPIIVRFCGYYANTDYGFTSRGLHPYDRSFQIRDDNTAMLMGWPHRAGQRLSALDQFRLGAQKCNTLHKFHASAASVDNDCYLRVGVFTSTPEAKVREKVQEAVRELLVEKAPIYEIIDRTTLCVARYTETNLALEKTEVSELDAITASEMVDLYPDANSGD